MEKTLNDLLKLTVDFKQLSLKYNGWSTKVYKKDGFRIVCYFSENSNHTAVSFNNPLFREFEVSFFNPPEFFFKEPYANNKSLKSLFTQYKKFYKEIKKQLETESKEEKEQRRLDRIKLLEKELKELKIKK